MKVKSQKPKATSFSIKNLKSLKILAFLIACFVVNPASAFNIKSGLVNEIPATDLKAFEGFYQLPSKVAYIEITKKGENLIATQIWDKREYVLFRKADLDFESRDEEHKASFFKDDAGKITGAKIFNRIIITRVNYDPTKTAVLTSNQLQILTGKYRFQRDKNLFLEISAKNNSLTLKQLWDGKVFDFIPKSELTFYNTELNFPLNFKKEEGIIKLLTCFANDVWDKVE